MLLAPDVLTEPAGLAPRQRRRAQLAGAIGFGLIAVGLNLAALVFAFMGAGLLAAAFSDDYVDDSGHVTQSALNAILDAYAAPVGATTAGAVLLVTAGLITSLLILRAGGHVRGRAITWAGAGISCILNVAAAVVAYFGAWAIAGVISPGAPVGFDHDLEAITIALVLDAVFGAAIGALVWWWMANVFRARAAPEV
ncbi:MAG: hypothetical protein JWQ64_1419 [Subtercola sp.]|nr:hypothetical protein [Subtercola sp.]